MTHKKIPWRERPLQERLSAVGRNVVFNDVVKKIHVVLQRQMDAFGTRPEGQLAVIIGDTRTGKSRAVDAFMLDYSEAVGGVFETVDAANPRQGAIAGASFVTIRRGHEVLHPIIKIDVNPKPTFKGLLSDVIFALTRRRFSLRTMSSSEITTLIRSQLVGQEIRLLIFDDAQHVALTSGSGAFLAGEVFKVLAKATKAELVLIGTLALLDLTKTNDQLDGLGQQLHFVEPFEVPSDKNKDLMHFMASMSSVLPFDEKSKIADIDTAKRVHAYTHGHMGRISQLLQTTVQYAIENNLPFIDVDTIGLALKSRMGTPDDRNPFVLTNSLLAADMPIADRWKKRPAQVAEK